MQLNAATPQPQAEHRVLQSYQQPMLTGFSVNSNYPTLNNIRQNYGQNNRNNYGQNYNQNNRNNAAGYDNILNNSPDYYDYGLFNYNDVNRQGLYDDYNGLDSNNFASAGIRTQSPCSKSGINPLLILITLAGAGVGVYFVYNKLSNSGNRSLKTYSFTEYLDYIWTG